MSDIVLSSAVRENLQSLQGTAKLLNQTQSKLSTGLKVNSAIDNPTSFFTAKSLNNRASDLSTLQDNISLTIETLNAAATGIDSLTTLVEQAKSTANQALNTKVKASNATSTADFTTQTGNITALLNAASTETITLKVDGTTSTITAKGLTVSKFVSSLNGITGLSATVSGGKLKVEATNGRALEISSGVGSISTDLGLTGTYDNGVNRDSFASDYNALLDQIDQLTTDSSFNGVNLLNGDSTTAKFNEDGTSSLTVTGVTFNSAGLGLSDTSTTDLQTDSKIESLVSGLDKAVGTLRSQSSTFGNNLAVVQNRQEFTSDLINTLQAGAGKLTLADTNVEGANLLALQTRQQLGISALSLASQGDQAVLSLVR